MSTKDSDIYIPSSASDLTQGLADYSKYGELMSSNDGKLVKAGSSQTQTSFNNNGSNDNFSARSIATKDNESVLDASAATQDSEKDGEKKRMRRYMITQEIYETEKGYVTDLQNLVRNFFDALNSEYLAGVANSVSKTAPTTAEATKEDIVNNTKFGNDGGGGWITFDQKQSVVRNASHVLRVQKLFFKMLEDAFKTPTTNSTVAPLANLEEPVCSDPSVLHIARCFILMMPKLESVYLPFCTQHDNAIETLGAIGKVHPNRLQLFFDDCRMRMNTKLEISDFLIKPIQRICRYPLLMKELLKSTPVDSPDYAELELAMDGIKVLVGHVNESKKQSENAKRKELMLDRLTSGPTVTIRALGRSFGLSIDPDAKNLPSGILGDRFRLKLGNLIRAGGLHVSDRKSNPSEVVYHGVFLFSEIVFVLGAKKSGSYQLLHYIPLGQIITIRTELSETEAPNPVFRNGWRITWESEEKDTSEHAIDMGTKNEKERDAWMMVFADVVTTDKFTIVSKDNNSISAKSTISDQTAPTSPPTSEAENINSAMHTDLRFNDVFTADSLVINARTASIGGHKKSISNVPSLPNSTTSAGNGTLKGLFRRSSFNRPGGTGPDDKSRSSSASSSKRRPSIAKTASLFVAPSSEAGSGVNTPSTPTSPTSNIEKLAEVLKLSSPTTEDKQNSSKDSQANADIKEPTQLGHTRERRGSISDMANSVKSFVRGRAGSISGGLDRGSKMSLSDGAPTSDDVPDDKDKKSMWGRGLKSKIVTVGRFSAAATKGKNGSRDTLDAESESKDAKDSSDKEEKRKSTGFASIGRSFSKRRANTSESDTSKTSIKDLHNREPTTATTPSAELKPKAPSGPPMRPVPPPPVKDGSYKAAPPQSGSPSGSGNTLGEESSRPRAGPGVSRIAAIRAKRTSKVIDPNGIETADETTVVSDNNQ